jgi:hypothetical protein
LQHPFPSFDAQQQSSTLEDAFAQVAGQVAADHSTIGVHAWDLGTVLNWSLTIDRLYPTMEGHVMLGEALAKLLRPLVSGQ